MNEQLVDKVKEVVFNKYRWLCNHFCNLDGYCPTYDCGSLDRLKRLSDRQWLNSINKILKYYPNIEFDDMVTEVVDDIWHKRPGKKAVEKYGKKKNKGLPIDKQVENVCSKRKTCKGCPYEHAFGGCSSTVVWQENDLKEEIEVEK